MYKNCHDYDCPLSEHYSFNEETIFSIWVSYDTPTIVNVNKIAYMEGNKFSMLLDHERMLYVMVIWMNLFMMLLKIIMREELMMHDVLFIFQFLTFMWASVKSSCLAKRYKRKALVGRQPNTFTYYFCVLTWLSFCINHVLLLFQ